MLGANVMWGLMSPVSKVILVGGAITPLVITDLRIGGAMILFWITSFFQKPEHVNHKDLVSLFFASLLAIVFNHHDCGSGADRVRRDEMAGCLYSSR